MKRLLVLTIVGLGILMPTQALASAPCNPNYSGCLPANKDVDCSDLENPVKVLGTDVYVLDRDGDKIACETDESGGTSSGSDDDNSAGTDQDTLPQTGVSWKFAALVGFLTLALGTLLFAVSRKRRIRFTI